MRGRPRNRWQDEAREDGRWGWRRVARKGTQHTRGIGLEVSADKMVMSQDQNAGRIHSVRIGNSTFERVEEFKYLGTILTNQNSIAEKIKSRLRSGNACYHSVQNLCLPGCYAKI